MIRKVKLLPEWKRLIKQAWSIRLMVLAFILTLMEVILPFYTEDIPRSTFALLSGISVAGAFVTRLLAQQGVDK